MGGGPALPLRRDPDSAHALFCPPRRNMVKHKFDHLVCFVPGMLALGAHSGAVRGAKAERYVQLAADLTHTCWQMYHRMPTGGCCQLSLRSTLG